MIKNPIEQKWQELKSLVVKEDDSPETVEEIREIFFIGAVAHHAVVMSADSDATCAEINNFVAQFQRKKAGLH